MKLSGDQVTTQQATSLGGRSFVAIGLAIGLLLSACDSTQQTVSADGTLTPTTDATEVGDDTYPTTTSTPSSSTPETTTSEVAETTTTTVLLESQPENQSPSLLESIERTIVLEGFEATLEGEDWGLLTINKLRASRSGARLSFRFFDSDLVWITTEKLIYKSDGDRWTVEPNLDGITSQFSDNRPEPKGMEGFLSGYKEMGSELVSSSQDQSTYLMTCDSVENVVPSSLWDPVCLTESDLFVTIDNETQLVSQIRREGRFLTQDDEEEGQNWSEGTLTMAIRPISPDTQIEIPTDVDWTGYYCIADYFEADRNDYAAVLRLMATTTEQMARGLVDECSYWTLYYALQED